MKFLLISAMVFYSGILIDPRNESPCGNITETSAIKGLEFNKLNFQESISISNYPGIGYVKSSGKLNVNDRIGVWEFFNNEGHLVLKYDYLSKSLIYFNPEEYLSQNFYLLGDKKITKSAFDRPPIPIPPVDTNWKLNTNFVYPPDALVKSISGVVKVSYIIDENGNPKDFKVEKGIGGGCDEEVIRVIKAQVLPNKWLPAILNGKSVSVKFEFEKEFKLR